MTLKISLGRWAKQHLISNLWTLQEKLSRQCLATPRGQVIRCPFSSCCRVSWDGNLPPFSGCDRSLDGRNRARVIAESLARDCHDSNHKRSLAVISPPKAQKSLSPPKALKSVLIDPTFVVPRFGSRDWRSFVQHSFHVELRNGLQKLTALAEH